MKPTFFRTPKDLRAWLEKNHAKETELLVGCYKVDSGKPSITWPQLVDEVLCFGWIDGIRKGIDADSYSIRITPRKPRSIWSAVNIKRMKELIAENRVVVAGMAAWAKRDEKRAATYSYERENAALDAAFERKFKADKKAWKNFNEMPPGYRRLMIHRIISAKKQETRERRLAELMEFSRRGERIPLV